MGIKIKKSPKPVGKAKGKAKNKRNALKSKKAKNSQVTKKPNAVGQKSQKSQTKPKVCIDLKALIASNKTNECTLIPEQVTKAVSAAFKAFSTSQEKLNGGKLFDQDPEPINLLVSAIKIPNGEPRALKIELPNAFLNTESDICLVVKDLKKGWKNDHEPTIHHYEELLRSKNVTCINEVMPLRQLRIEFKPYEARGKLEKRFDVMLVDQRAAKFVPRYLGKSFYQAGKLPVSLNIEAEDLTKEVNQALATSIMSMCNTGTSTQIQVGVSSQTEKEVADNIMAVYQTLEKQFPGNFANVRSLTLRFGISSWTVPIYISYATRDSVILPAAVQRAEPVIDDLSTLSAGWKVAVYPSGEVRKIKDENYQKTALDPADSKKKKKNTKQALKSKKNISDDEEEDEDLDDDEEEDLDSDEDDEVDVKKKRPLKKKKPASKEIVKEDDVASDTEASLAPGSKAKNTSKETTVESSEDEGDLLEEEYMKELDLLEEEQAPVGEVSTETEIPPPAKRSKTKPLVKSVNKKKRIMKKKSVKSD